jgi:hypothetical protein
MSLDKAIKYKKEKRKPYYGAKNIDPSCRNHGSCPTCQMVRRFKKEKQNLSSEYEYPEHNTDSGECWCEPEIIKFENGNKLIVHNDFQ